jgi:excisionase family DNA binding protein
VDLLNVVEAADFLGVHPGTIYAWVESRRLPCLRVGSRIRFVRDDLLAWARGHGDLADSDRRRDDPGTPRVVEPRERTRS